MTDSPLPHTHFDPHPRPTGPGPPLRAGKGRGAVWSHGFFASIRTHVRTSPVDPSRATPSRRRRTVSATAPGRWQDQSHVRTRASRGGPGRGHHGRSGSVELVTDTMPTTRVSELP